MCCLRCMAFDFSTFSALHFDVSGETAIKPPFSQTDLFFYIPLHLSYKIVICSRNSNVLASIPDPHPFIDPS